jgi:hypothetical protein
LNSKIPLPRLESAFLALCSLCRYSMIMYTVSTWWLAGFWRLLPVFWHEGASAGAALVSDTDRDEEEGLRAREPFPMCNPKQASEPRVPSSAHFSKIHDEMVGGVGETRMMQRCRNVPNRSLQANRQMPSNRQRPAWDQLTIASCPIANGPERCSSCRNRTIFQPIESD